jgi:hypothetical protein
VSKLEARIKRIEKRVAIDEKPPLTMEELHHYIKLKNPEWLRQKAMDPHCNGNVYNALNTPTPKKIIRMFRRGILERWLKEQREISDARARKSEKQLCEYRAIEELRRQRSTGQPDVGPVD